jgi:arginine-tRNA-protein transferase
MMTEALSHHESTECESAAEETAPHLTPEQPCPYLPERTSRNEAYLTPDLPPALYEAFMGLGFRRSGGVVYRPRCGGCTACRPLRVLVAGFTPTRSMRRVLRANRDVVLRRSDPTPTAEKYNLFRGYLDAQHDTTMSRSASVFLDFLYASPTDTTEFTYHVGDRLVGASIADVCPSGLSSVYMYFDPALARRSLGTLSILREIDYSASRGWPYYFLGYYVAGAATMSYKARFAPNDILDEHGRWVAFRGARARGPGQQGSERASGNR